MNGRKDPRNRQRGESLVELLVSLGLITLVLTVFVLALAAGAQSVAVNRQLTEAHTLALSQLESIKAAPYQRGAASYPGIASGGYTLNQTIRYWDGAVFSDVAANDQGMQQITVAVMLNGQTLLQLSNYKVDR